MKAGKKIKTVKESCIQLAVALSHSDNGQIKQGQHYLSDVLDL